jgi:hypothetical protein
MGVYDRDMNTTSTATEERLQSLAKEIDTYVIRTFNVCQLRCFATKAYIHVVRMDADYITRTVLIAIEERFPVRLVYCGGKDVDTKYPNNQCMAMYKLTEENKETDTE